MAMAGEASWFFVINPCAGGGRGRRRWQAVARALNKAGVHYQANQTRYPGHATELVVEALDNGWRRFAVIGGDGSLNEIINGLCRRQAWLDDSCLALFPCGTGNDWAAQYPLPHKAHDFALMLKNAQTRQQDIGCVAYDDKGERRYHYFVNFTGAGFDSYLLARMGEAGGHKWRYLLHVLKCLRQFSSPQQSITVNGHTNSANMLMTMICIGRQGGAGMLFAPDARLDDGLLDVVQIRDMSFLRRLFSLVYLFNGKINRHAMVNSCRTDYARLAGDSNLQFQCDGELVGHLPIIVNLLDKKLHVVVSKPGY